MEKHRRNRKVYRKTKPGFFQKLFTHTGGNPEAIENQDWCLDSMDVRLTRIFNLVLIFHVLAVGGILGFKMFGKASSPAMSSLARAETKPSIGITTEKIVSAKAEPARAATVPGTINPVREDRYCVLAGDSLSTIAARLNVTTRALCLANHITSPDEILPGMWLKIPAPVVVDPVRESIDHNSLPEHPVAMKAQNPERYQEPINELLYPVRKGDTAWGIAQRFKVNTNELLKYNGIDPNEILQIGQILKIPRK